MDKDTKEFYWDMGNRIRTLRMNKNNTVEELAEKVGISTKYLYQIESGKVNFSTEILRKICSALGVLSTTLLAEEEIDTGTALLSAMLGKFTEEDKKYFKSILLKHLEELM